MIKPTIHQFFKTSHRTHGNWLDLLGSQDTSGAKVVLEDMLRQAGIQTKDAIWGTSPGDYVAVTYNL